MIITIIWPRMLGRPSLLLSLLNGHPCLGYCRGVFIGRFFKRSKIMINEIAELLGLFGIGIVGGIVVYSFVVITAGFKTDE
jgi:hypothetical protein